MSSQAILNQIQKIHSERETSQIQLNELPLEIFAAWERKFGPLKQWPWWRRLYFFYAWRPFFRFSFNVIGIPAPTTVDEKGNANWDEFIGPFSSKALAVAACPNEFCRVKRYILDEPLSTESVQVPAIYPMAKNPNRYLRPVFAHHLPLAQLRDFANAVERLENIVGT